MARVLGWAVGCSSRNFIMASVLGWAVGCSSRNFIMVSVLGWAVGWDSRNFIMVSVIGWAVGWDSWLLFTFGVKGRAMTSFSRHLDKESSQGAGNEFRLPHSCLKWAWKELMGGSPSQHVLTANFSVHFAGLAWRRFLTTPSCIITSPTSWGTRGSWIWPLNTTGRHFGEWKYL
jgi:hypothetical protein